jgi:hypothetical protein
MEPYDSSWINKKATHQGVAFCFSKGIGLQVQMKKRFMVSIASEACFGPS